MLPMLRVITGLGIISIAITIFAFLLLWDD